MENKDYADKDRDKLSENNYDTNPPTEFIESKSRKSKTTPPDESDKQNDLEKFRRGELGASHIGYNDDGSTHRESQKMDIDTEVDPK